MAKVNRTVLDDTVPSVQYFSTGGVVRTANDLFSDSTGVYQWRGEYPITVPPNSTPETAGGVGSTSWVRLLDSGIREALELENANNFPKLDFISNLTNVDVPAGCTALRYKDTVLINWKPSGDFSTAPRTITSEPALNKFNEFIVSTTSGEFVFVTPYVHALRTENKLTGWGYPENDDFASTFIKALNSTGILVIDSPVNILQDTAIDCTKLTKHNCRVYGDQVSEANITISTDKRLFFKSASGLHFRDLRIVGLEPSAYTSTVRTAVWFTNFNDVSLKRCTIIGFGDPINYTSGTCAMWFAAQSSTNFPEFIATGNSVNAVIEDCDFTTTSDRSTNFAVRAYTPFDDASSTCDFVKIHNCRFTGYNWNAVEIGGLGTRYCTIDDSVAYQSGLTPFDLDKGCSYCEVRNCVADGIRGNINTIDQPNTNAVAWHIQGVTAASGYAHHNKISNCRTIMYLSDMLAYPNSHSLVSSSYGYSNRIEDISLKVVYDVPKADYVQTKKKLYTVIFESITDTTFSGIRSNFCTHGVYQFLGTNSNLYPVAPCVFKDITVDEDLTGEYILIQRGVSAARQGYFVFDNLSMSTSMSNASTSTPITFEVEGSSTHYLKVLNSQFSTSGSTSLVLAKTGSLELRGVVESGTSISPSTVLSGACSLVNVCVQEVLVNYGRTSFDSSNFDVFSSQGTLVCSGISATSQPMSGVYTLSSTKTGTSPFSIPASRVRGYCTVMSSTGVSSGSDVYGAWSNVNAQWRLTHKLV